MVYLFTDFLEPKFTFENKLSKVRNQAWKHNWDNDEFSLVEIIEEEGLQTYSS